MAGRYDAAARRRSQREGRERGCWVYIAAEELTKTGADLDGPPPLYRVWAGPRGRVVVQLYRDDPQPTVQSEHARPNPGSDDPGSPTAVSAGTSRTPDGRD